MSPAQPLILIVDDDAELATMLVELLAREGWATHTVLTAGDAVRALKTQQPDLVLLDAMLPDGNGFDLARRWRTQHPALGLVMLTARGDPLDRVLGLEIGADDYLPKPFEPRELVARIRALLRRTTPGRGETAVLRFAGLAIDILKREVTAGGGADARVVALTSVEFKLLCHAKPCRTRCRPAATSRRSARACGASCATPAQAPSGSTQCAARAMCSCRVAA
jgi:DNA-binding response OmpR family regulator